MSCYRPNFILKHKVRASLALEYKFQEKRGMRSNGWKMMKEGNSEYKFLKGYDYDAYIKTQEYYDLDNIEVVPIPCGQCVGCRLDYSRDWANRCYLESLSYKDNYFITLTYDDDHIPISHTGNNTLRIDDFTKFLKDVRRYWKYHFNYDGIRFFGCGEYGDLSMRPHLHLIMFNFPIPDLVPDFIYYDEDGRKIVTQHVSNGYIYMFSEILSKIWNKGNILVGKAEWQSMAYVSRYVMKKQKGEDSAVYDKLGIVPEFVRMSRMPGIGEKYFKEHYNDIYKYDNLVVYHDGPKSIQPPRYFDRLVDRFNLSEIDLQAIKDFRKSRSEDVSYTNSILFQSSYLDLLEHLESTKSSQIIALKKKL